MFSHRFRGGKSQAKRSSLGMMRTSCSPSAVMKHPQSSYLRRLVAVMVSAWVQAMHFSWVDQEDMTFVLTQIKGISIAIPVHTPLLLLGTLLFLSMTHTWRGRSSGSLRSSRSGCAHDGLYSDVLKATMMSISLRLARKSLLYTCKHELMSQANWHSSRAFIGKRRKQGSLIGFREKLGANS